MYKNNGGWGAGTLDQGRVGLHRGGGWLLHHVAVNAVPRGGQRPAPARPGAVDSRVGRRIPCAPVAGCLAIVGRWTMMNKYVRLGFVMLAVAGGASGVASIARPAEAQGLERCGDLGVMVQHVSEGFVVRSVMRGGIANELGLSRGDLIFAIDGEHPQSLDDLHQMIFRGADRSIHDLDVLRRGQHLHAAIYHIDDRVYFTNRLH